MLVIGLPFLGLAQLYARAFYAVGDARTPARLAGVLVCVNALLNLLLLWLTDLGTAGLTLASSVSSLANAHKFATKIVVTVVDEQSYTFNTIRRKVDTDGRFGADSFW